MTRRIVSAFALGLAASLALWSLLDTRVVESTEPLVVVIETTDHGYKCVQGCTAVSFAAGNWDLRISVERGQLVDLSFVWAHEAFPKEEHIMVLEGYGLETRQIDATNRRASLRFVADRPGDFRVYCDQYCDLHPKMQSGLVSVSRTAGVAAAAASYTPTSLSLSSSAATWTADEPLLLKAVLTDASGNPVPRAEVRFFVNAEFVGVKAPMLVGRARTDEKGTAQVRVDAPLGPGEHTFSARFDQMGVYDGSDQSLSVKAVGTAGTDPSSHGRLEDLRGVGTTLLAVIMLTVWGLLGLVALQVVAIARSTGTKDA